MSHWSAEWQRSHVPKQLLTLLTSGFFYRQKDQAYANKATIALPTSMSLRHLQNILVLSSHNGCISSNDKTAQLASFVKLYQERKASLLQESSSKVTKNDLSAEFARLMFSIHQAEAASEQANRACRYTAERQVCLCNVSKRHQYQSPLPKHTLRTSRIEEPFTTV